MYRIVTFVLRDGTKHATLEKAKDHCKEKMLATTRALYLKCVGAVENSTYDEGFSEYLAWRKEHDELINYEQDDESEE